MSQDQLLIITILVVTVGLFLWGRWRHDIVAGAALLAAVFAGLVPRESAFSGFGHPAVITVACVLVMSYGLQLSGAIDVFARKVLPTKAGPVLTVAALTAVGAVLSAFMNNVGALALLMPVALQLAGKRGMPPGKVLMPLAFGTILGGMTTMIGTPPNLIVAGFREEAGMGSFGMFDFSPVGGAVAAAGVLFIVLLGWRIVPVRKQSDLDTFDAGRYFTEVRVTANSKAAGKTVREVEKLLDDSDAQIIGLVRNEVRVIAPNLGRVLRDSDILVLEAEPESMTAALSLLDLKLEEAVPMDGDDEEDEETSDEAVSRQTKETQQSHESGMKQAMARHLTASGRKQLGQADSKAQEDGRRDEDSNEDRSDKSDSDEVVIQELVVMPQASLIGRSATSINLRTRYGLNLLAISRQGRRSVRRLRKTDIAAGDVLLMQGTPEALSGFASDYGCVPLAARQIRLPNPRQALLATGIMLAAISWAALGLLPAAISFASGVFLFMVLRIVPLRKAYDAVDWPVIVLLAAMIPVAGAMASTGTADILARLLLERVAFGEPVIALALILIVTMTLSDFMNNAATAAVMCPIAISSAAQLGSGPDIFLMAVAIGASCAFLTPIGHQNNTLILGPGGFRFSDYWRLGLPMEILVVVVSLPMLLWVWGF